MKHPTGGTPQPPSDELFTAYYEQHHDRVLAYARRRLPEDAARDATAETFTTAWRRWNVAADGGLPWLYTTASHVVDTAHRTSHRAQALWARAASQPAGVSPDHADAHAEREAVSSVLRQLPDQDRELLLLTVWEQLDVATAAGIVGTSPGAARVRLHRARRRLRALLDAQDQTATRPTRSEEQVTADNGDPPPVIDDHSPLSARRSQEA